MRELKQSARPPEHADWSSLHGVREIRITPENTVVSFAVRWLGGLAVRGTFADLGGLIRIHSWDPLHASVSVDVAVNSVRTGISLRDRHLRTLLFLGGARFPTSTFRAETVAGWSEQVGLAGGLAIRGVTRLETMVCTIEYVRDDGQRPSVVVAGAMTLQRTAYRVGWPPTLRRLDPSLLVIGDIVQVRSEVRLSLDELKPAP